MVDHSPISQAKGEQFVQDSLSQLSPLHSNLMVKVVVRSVDLDTMASASIDMKTDYRLGTLID